MKPHSNQPLYLQVEHRLLEQIRQNYRAGQLLPTQQQIATQHGVSLITVKRALDEIARRGLIESTRGRGTVVRTAVVPDKRSELTTWKDNVTGLSITPRTAWVRINTRIPPRETAHSLRLKPRSRTVLVERLRTVEGKPICLSSHEFPLELVPDLPRFGFTEESLYAHLQKRYGLSPHSADEEVTSRRATSDERELLGHDTDLVMVVRRHTWLRSGRPLEVVEVILPAHRYQYRIKVFARESGKEGA